MTERPSKLFVGVGNVLKHDEGVGVRAAEVMARLPLFDDIEVYDAGTAGITAATTLEKREQVVVVDALQANAQPGAVYRFTPDQLRPQTGFPMSIHDVHFLDALEETRLTRREPNHVVVFAVQVADVSTGIGLSAPVEQALHRVLALAADELRIPYYLIEEVAAVPSSWVTSH